MKKIVIAVAIIVFIAGASFYIFRIYLPKQGIDMFKRNAATEKAEVVKADDLFKEFTSNEAAFNTKYLNKNLQVSGIIKAINANNITIVGTDTTSCIQCDISKLEGNVKTGKTIAIKGICTGALSDLLTNGVNVQLKDGVITEVK